MSFVARAMARSPNAVESDLDQASRKVLLVVALSAFQIGYGPRDCGPRVEENVILHISKLWAGGAFIQSRFVESPPPCFTKGPFRPRVSV